jgi:pimeloyl-ACP methyl ester carboxylesterase
MSNINSNYRISIKLFIIIFILFIFNNFAFAGEFGVNIPENISPVMTMNYPSKDGTEQLTLCYRKPHHEGVSPVIVFFHGGWNKWGVNALRDRVLTGNVQTRFLKAGYIVVQSNRRAFPDFSIEGVGGAKSDCALAIRKAKKISGADPNSVVLYCGSGGGAMGMTVAGWEYLNTAVLVIGEPATLIWNRMLKPGGDQNAVIADPWAYWNDYRRDKTRALLAKITCPVLMLHGDVHPAWTLNMDIIYPEMLEINDISTIIYEGYNHGFYWGEKLGNQGLEITETFVIGMVEDVNVFLRSKIITQPIPMD